MGCLTLHIEDRTRSDIQVSVIPKNDLDVKAEAKNIPLEVNTENKNCIVVLKKNCKNVPVKVNTENRNTGINIRIGLVCQVSLSEKYQVFYVNEGPFIVEEGYFKVAK